MDMRRDVVERLDRLGIAWYITGSEALALYGLGYRQTNHVDFVLAIDADAYETRLRPLFEPAYVVNALVEHLPRLMGGAIHVASVGKADFILRQPGPWPTAALARRVRIADVAFGTTWVSSREDLLLAKLEWSEGNLDGLQGRDVVALIKGFEDAMGEREAALLRRRGYSDQ
jgi:hypothetical protein